MAFLVRILRERCPRCWRFISRRRLVMHIHIVHRGLELLICGRITRSGSLTSGSGSIQLLSRNICTSRLHFFVALEGYRRSMWFRSRSFGRTPPATSRLILRLQLSSLRLRLRVLCSPCSRSCTLCLHLCKCACTWYTRSGISRFNAGESIAW